MGNRRWDSKSKRRRSRQESTAKGAEKSLLIVLGLFVAGVVLLLLALALFGGA